ncbi:hypothetical protein JAK47_01835 [Stenotrophomonas maltophilia]|uniref:hypothetical protein n=1 Tax=Stenotrophomonas maltophilia TaxID=40324 RepID=UPI0021CA2935|nr:hypothetical protein [Stenotrophomonas maltophilia]MCU1053286.1 hypothetical protein [Stenotrophomonas maltophilia]
MADWHTIRRDSEDDYEDARETYIAERSAELLTEYQCDEDMICKALDEFMGFRDAEDLGRALRRFLGFYRNTDTDRGIADAANVLAADLQSYINPILREWAEDKALEEVAQNEANQSESREAA